MTKKDTDSVNLLYKIPTPGNNDNILSEIFYNCTKCSSLIILINYLYIKNK